MLVLKDGELQLSAKLVTDVELNKQLKRVCFMVNIVNKCLGSRKKSPTKVLAKMGLI